MHLFFFLNEVFTLAAKVNLGNRYLPKTWTNIKSNSIFNKNNNLIYLHNKCGIYVGYQLNQIQF